MPLFVHSTWGLSLDFLSDFLIAQMGTGRVMTCFLEAILDRLTHRNLHLCRA